MSTSQLLSDFRSALGPAAVKSEGAEVESYFNDWRGRIQGKALCVIEPSTTDEVALVVRMASRHGVTIIPQGGNTGLVGGSVPLAGGDEGKQVVLSLRRMNRIRHVDTLDNVIVVDAGVILKDAQTAASENDRLLPISFAAEGSALIGGAISTNAGGTNVLRYGNTRDQVLGLEVVLADGTVWYGLQKLRKNNTGYDLKQLFIGAEGTLGIVTAATLKLYPSPKASTTALVAVPSPEAAIRLLRDLQSELGDCLTAFELMERSCLDLVFAATTGLRDPLETKSPWYVLTDVSSTLRGQALDDVVEAALANALGAGLVSDAAMARSEAQRAELWRLREEITEAERRFGPSAKHDVSIPISRIPEFLSAASTAVRSHLPHAKPVAFGHVGDGNIHFNVLAPAEETEAIGAIVYKLVTELDGSISAEHGIGTTKIALLEQYKDETSMALMRTIRTALDPSAMLNPGRLFQCFPREGRTS